MSCQYTCDEGYYNATSTEITCLENRTWNLNPECEIVKCPPAPRIPKGMTTCTAQTYGTFCDYYCEEGYVIPETLSDSTRLICTAEGVWEPRILPKCWADKPPEVHNCSSDINIFIEFSQAQVSIPFPTFTRAENGDILETKCNLKTNETLKEGSHVVVCNATDHEINKHATCNFSIAITSNQSSCQPKLSPANGFLENCKETSGSQCYYGCNADYRRTGPNPVTCTRRQWNADIGCTIVKCTRSLPRIANGYFNCTGNTPGTACTYSCFEGYKIPKKHESRIKHRCENTGYWVGDSKTPECWVNQPPQMTNCSQGINLTSYIKELVVPIPKPQFTSVRGDVIVTSCPKYKARNATLPTGEHAVTCTGTDIELGRQTTCTYVIRIKAAVCAKLDPPANGSLVCSDIGGSRVCTIFCRPGFSVPSSEYGGYFCLKGIWSKTQVPNCTENKIPNSVQSEASYTYSTNSSCPDNATMQRIKEHFIKEALGYLCTRDCSVKDVVLACGRSLRRRRDVWNTIQQRVFGLTKTKNSNRVKRMASTDTPRPTVENKLTIAFALSVTFAKDTNYTAEMHNTAAHMLSAVLGKVEEGVRNGVAFPFAAEFNLSLTLNNVVTRPVEILCDEGYFWNPSSARCVTCPAGFFVNSAGGSSYKRCSKCDIGEYQDRIGQTQCKKCPPGTRSPFAGAKNLVECEEIDSCESSPCQNNGICIDGKSSYHCECALGFTGTDCTEFDCNFHECRNNGTCFAIGSDYNCTCLEEFIGDRCQYQRVHGGWSPWSSFGECTASCGTGNRLRSRTCTNPSPMYGGRRCNGSENDRELCNQHGCTVDGQWGKWSNWTDCSRTCGGGIQNRARMCDNPPPAYGGLSCEGARLEKKQCNNNLCPVNGGMGPWSGWTLCSRSCEGGEQRRNRSCDNPPPSNGGLHCNESLEEERPCNVEECPPPPSCDFAPCQNNGTCVNNGSDYTCSCPRGFTGKNCTLNDCSENDCHNNALCLGLEDGYKCLCQPSFTGKLCEVRMVDGKWSPWGEWGGCTRRDEGERSRNRTCSNPLPQNGGRDCTGDAQEIAECPECAPKLLRAPPNGMVRCSKNNGMTSCTALCERGFGFSTAVPNGGRYECGPDTGWLWFTQTNPKRFELPDCTQGDDSQEVVAKVDVKDLPCDESTIEEVREQVQKYLNVLDGPTKNATVQCLESVSSNRKRSVDSLGLQIVTKITYNSSEIGQTEMTELLEEADTMLANGSVQFDIKGVVYTASPNMTAFVNCSQGSIFATGSNICVKCQQGTYYTFNNFGVAECTPCSPGEYQPETGQLECLDCGVGFTTEDSGAKNQTECIACPPGTYYLRHGDNTQGAECVRCGIGFYQPQKGATSCFECRKGMTTNGLGSTDKDDCRYVTTTPKTTQRHTSTPVTTQFASSVPETSSARALLHGSTTSVPPRMTTHVTEYTIVIIASVSVAVAIVIVAIIVVAVKANTARRAAYAVAQKKRCQSMDMKELSYSVKSRGGKQM